MSNEKVYLLLFALLGNDLSAQDSVQYKKLALTIAPLSLIDKQSFQSIQAGLEYRFDPHYSINCSYGYIFGKETYNHSEGNGIKLKGEFKRYSRIYRTSKFSRYWAFEGFYNKVNYMTKSDFEDPVNSEVYQDKYSIKKEAWGLNLKFGVNFDFLKRFVIDFYTGVGVRHKVVRHFDRMNPQDEFSFYELYFGNIRDKKGVFTTPNIVLGFNIGYILWNKM